MSAIDASRLVSLPQRANGVWVESAESAASVPAPAETDRLAAARVEQAQAVDEGLARARAAAEDPADRSS
jgi:hypothetical protein